MPVIGFMIAYALAGAALLGFFAFPLVSILRTPRALIGSGRWGWLVITASLGFVLSAFAGAGYSAAIAINWLVYLAFLWRVRVPARKDGKRWAVPALGGATVLVLAFLGALLHSQRLHERQRHASHEVDWPIDDEKSRIQLRLPPNVNYSSGPADVANARGSTRPIARSIEFERLWPEMASRNEQNEAVFHDMLNYRVLNISVEPQRPEADDLQKFYDDTVRDATMSKLWPSPASRPDASTRPSGMITPDRLDVKTSRYGLGHLGIDLSRYPALQAADYGQVSNPDVWFFPVDGAALETVIKCTNDQVITARTWPDDCEQHFFYQPLNAVVSVRFRSRFLAEWQEIRASVGAKLAGMIKNPLPPSNPLPRTSGGAKTAR